MKNQSDKIKRMIRNLKKEEIRIMQGIYGIDNVSYQLIWNQFFDLKKPYKGLRYNLDQLINMNIVELEQVIDDYFNTIFIKFYQDTTVKNQSVYDIFGLPANASMDEIKKRFRVLAKQMHPDTGGSNEDFIILNDAYHELKKKNNII